MKEKYWRWYCNDHFTCCPFLLSFFLGIVAVIWIPNAYITNSGIMADVHSLIHPVFNWALWYRRDTSWCLNRVRSGYTMTWMHPLQFPAIIFYSLQHCWSLFWCCVSLRTNCCTKSKHDKAWFAFRERHFLQLVWVPWHLSQKPRGRDGNFWDLWSGFFLGCRQNQNLVSNF